jgi:hypothetical protein
MLLQTMPLKLLKPIKGPKDWLMHPTEDGDFLFVGQDTACVPAEFDCAEFRNALLSAKTPIDLGGFLAKYGDPGMDAREYVGTRKYLISGKPMQLREYAPRRTPAIFFRKFLELQAALRGAMKTPLEEWTFGEHFELDDLPIELELSAQGITGVCRVHNGVTACYASTFLEKTAGFQYGWCSFCGRHFLRESQHAKKYCDSRCAGLAAVRAFRGRRAEGLRTIKTRHSLAQE